MKEFFPSPISATQDDHAPMQGANRAKLSLIHGIGYTSG